MEPLRGGQLAQNPPRKVKDIMEKADIKRSPADWALQWLWDQPEVSVVLSGMSTIKQVKEPMPVLNVVNVNRPVPRILR